MAIEVKVPDIGDFTNIPVIEVLVKVGDTVRAEDALVTLESDKATMEVPAPSAGVVKELKVKLGDKVSEGSVILILEAADGAAKPAAGSATDAAKPATSSAPAASALAAPSAAPAAPTTAQSDGAETGVPNQPGRAAINPTNPPTVPVDQETFVMAHASPAIRQFARELGVDLGKVKGSAPKGRILREDVQAFVKSVLQSAASAPGGAAAGIGLGLLPWPQVDFAKYGPIEVLPLSRIKKMSGANLHRNWVMIPHVTNNDDADITELESFRLQLNQENAKSGVKVTLLAFLIKAVCNALKKFPELNASLDGDNLILKRYYNIGFAADTPNGLVVPVIKDADKKGVMQIAAEASAFAAKARDGKLGPADMQGGTFSISSLGGIGGTYFTPIINAPEVAILGVCRSTIRPVWRDNAFVPRLVAPLSLSYDHRVIDGALAARFNTYLVGLLADMRRATL
jgi:pyruvate dehydrogenase E2 component (dihydrolipoamide acetyltransferase)